MNKKNIIVVLFLLFSLSFVVAGSQKISTEHVDFELPYTATHYWNPSGLDTYEVIVSNFSIKNNNDYILRITWNDERYIEDKIQIHYEFKENKLKENDIKIYSLTDYDKSCLDDINSDKNYNKCEKEKKSKLKFKNKKIEIGTLVGYEYHQEKNKSCDKKEECNLINVTTPIYSWSAFSDIDINNLPSNFIAVDDVEINTCGTLNIQNETYILNESIVGISGDCFLIENSSITLNLNGYNITGDGSGDGIKPQGLSSINITVENGTISGFSDGLYLSGGQSSTFRNLIIQNTADDGIEITTGGLGQNYNNFSNITLLNIGDDGIVATNGFNSFDQITISAPGWFGINLNSNNNNFTNFIISASTEEGLYSSASSNNIFYNGNISGAINNTRFKTSSINNVLINVTYDTEFIDATSQLIRRWYFDGNTSGVEGVSVIGYNVFEDTTWSILSGVDGIIPQQVLTEYVNNGTITYYTPHVLTASKTNFGSNTTTFNLTIEQNYYYNFGLIYSEFEEVCDTINDGIASFAIWIAIIIAVVVAGVLIGILNVFTSDENTFSDSGIGDLVKLVVGVIGVGIVLGLGIYIISTLLSC